MFKTPNLIIDENGIDLIKNYQVSGHIDYADIRLVEIRKGHYIPGWMLALIIGISVSVFTAFWLINSLQSLTFDTIVSTTLFKNFLSVSIITPFCLFVGGLILCFLSFKMCAVIVITTHHKVIKESITELEKNKELPDLIAFLSRKVDCYSAECFK